MQSKYPSPISHWAIGDYIRTPMIIDGDDYILCVGDNDIRIFTEQTLPDFVKSLMTMIHAFTPNLFDTFSPMKGVVFQHNNGQLQMMQSIYDNNQDYKLSEIGWQLTQNLYMLILTTNQFHEVRDGNARKQSKEQGKTSPS